MADITKFLSTIRELYGDRKELTRAELRALAQRKVRVPGHIWQFGIPGTHPMLFSIEKFEEMISKGQSNPIPAVEESKEEIPASLQMYIPKVDEDFLPYGENYEMVDKIVSSKIFFPAYIYGISGVGKTASIEHSCAVHNRPFFRVQITQETIDEDLIGSMRLKDGNTVWEDGPVIRAYRTGGVCVLDEMDLNAQLMILQPILEGKPFYIKQTGELVEPAEGFTVFATGNTKGDGADMRYIGTTVLNEAFLERFAITMEQSFMPFEDELNAAKHYVKRHNISIKGKLLRELMKFVNLSREQYVNNGYDGAFISTRRIRFILNAYVLIGNMTKAIDMATTRYSDTYREAMGMLWNSVHDDSAEREEEQMAQHRMAAMAPESLEDNLSEIESDILGAFKTSSNDF